MTGNELRHQRKALKLTQAQLARELDVSRTTLIGWESRSEENIPRLAELAIIAVRKVPGVRQWVSDGIDIGRVEP